MTSSDLLGMSTKQSPLKSIKRVLSVSFIIKNGVSKPLFLKSSSHWVATNKGGPGHRRIVFSCLFDHNNLKAVILSLYLKYLEY